MIVMKFGGASLHCGAALKRVVAIVDREVSRVREAASSGDRAGDLSAAYPAVVVSAIGDTTDHLVETIDLASRGQSYLALKVQDELKNLHYCIAEDVLSGKRLEQIQTYLRQSFRDLHVRILEVSEGDVRLTSELRDWVMSLGEQWSSRIMAAALEENGVATTHLDARRLILTCDRFTSAVPRSWETYARLRWSVPLAARQHVVVMGGFIGATEDGRTTTLGRGGSDLTASIVGAAVNADEIQVWKDVDGMLTWDPRLKNADFLVRELSYEEADELARAGATILHPDTVAPARRLRIPVVIRNTFRPDDKGTRIGSRADQCQNLAKSIACKRNLTVIELHSPGESASADSYLPLVQRICREQNVATVLAASDEAIYLALEDGPVDGNLSFLPDRCFEVHVRSRQAVITLVGQGISRAAVVTRLSHVLARNAAVILPQSAHSCSVRLLVPDAELSTWINLLQQTFFAQVDPAVFAPVTAPATVRTQPTAAQRATRERSRSAVPVRARPAASFSTN